LKYSHERVFAPRSALQWRQFIRTGEVKTLAEDKLYKAEYVGSGTFLISKPKRKKSKQRQSNLKNVSRGSRK
jgi:hypothetical protein